MTPSTPTDNADNVLRGSLLVLFAIAVFSALDALVKYEAARYPTAEIVFFRSVGATFTVTLLALRHGGPRPFRPHHWFPHVLRITFALICLFTLFKALAAMPLADVTAVYMTAPLIVAGLSRPVLNERVGPRRWFAILVGFIAVLFIVNPGRGVFGFVGILALIATFAYSGMVMTARRYRRTESTAALTFYPLFGATIVAAMAQIPVWKTPTIADMVIMLMIGLLNGFASFALTAAYRTAPAAVIAPIEYTGIVWAMIIGLVFWGEYPTQVTVVGAGVIIAVGLYVQWTTRETGRPLTPRRITVAAENDTPTADHEPASATDATELER